MKDPDDPTGYLTGVKAIAAGSSHSLALKEDGTVWAWGSNQEGQLGNGTNALGTNGRILGINTPAKVSELGGVKAIEPPVPTTIWQVSSTLSLVRGEHKRPYTELRPSLILVAGIRRGTRAGNLFLAREKEPSQNLPLGGAQQPILPVVC